MIRLSIVIPCVNGLPFIGRCLDAFRGQSRRDEAEVIVVNVCRDGTGDHIRRHHPDVVLIELPDRRGIPEMRWIGTRKAQGAIIAYTEDHCLPQAGWIDGMLREHDKGWRVVGGPVENASVERLMDWAVFFCEYADAMPPVPAGVTGGVPGNNSSFRRDLLDLVPAEIRQTCWEYFIYQAWASAGITFGCAPSLVMRHKKSFGFAYFMGQRYHYSRSFAAMRAARLTPARKWACALATPALPLLMLARITRRILRKQVHLGWFAAAFPLLCLFMVSYAWGEFAGYVSGSGDSLLKVE